LNGHGEPYSQTHAAAANPNGAVSLGFLWNKEKLSIVNFPRCQYTDSPALGLRDVCDTPTAFSALGGGQPCHPNSLSPPMKEQ
jgi:hypothetical protein